MHCQVIFDEANILPCSAMFCQKMTQRLATLGETLAISSLIEDLLSINILAETFRHDRLVALAVDTVDRQMLYRHYFN